MGGKEAEEYAPLEEMSTSDSSDASYMHVIVRAPRLSGISLKWFVWMLETGVIRSFVVPKMKKDNLITKFFTKATYQNPPMYIPQYPEAGPERLDQVTVELEVDSSLPPPERLKAAVTCLPPFQRQESDLDLPGSAGFRHWTIRHYADAFRSGSVTPTMVAERFLSALEDSINQTPGMFLFINYDEKDVLRQAEASTARYKRGEPLSVLDGVPVAVKDEIDCLPYPTTGGTTWLHKVRKIKSDAQCVKRLRECGAVLVGKTNMHELGQGTTSINPHYGASRNPHGKGNVSGGSSGGSAAVVASGLCPAALGVDGGGSVRMPAGLCGVVGFKATFGRTSNAGIIPLNWTVGMLGTLTATVEDALIMYAAVHGHLPQDRIVSLPPPATFPNLKVLSEAEPSRLKVVGGLKLGKYSEWFDDADDEVKEACYHALELLQQAYGNKIVEVTLPEIEQMRLAHFITIGSECYASLAADYHKAGFEDSGADVRVCFAIYETFSNVEFISSQRMRFRQMHYFMDIFKKADVVVTPITGCTAPALSGESLKYGELNFVTGAKLMRFQIAGNFLGLPAMSVPYSADTSTKSAYQVFLSLVLVTDLRHQSSIVAHDITGKLLAMIGHDKAGLPIGLQLIGRPWAEATILQLAAAFEEVCAPLRRRPEVLYDLLISTRVAMLESQAVSRVETPAYKSSSRSFVGDSRG